MDRCDTNLDLSIQKAATPMRNDKAAVVAVLALSFLSYTAVASNIERFDASEAFTKGQQSYEAGDYSMALQLWQEPATKGDVLAQNGLGVLFFHGRGIVADPAKGVGWFRKAAEQGYARAQYNMGNAYLHGKGVPQDFAQAAKWLAKAADQGHAYAQYNLGNMYREGEGVPRNYKRAVSLYEKAGEQGDILAQYNLGRMYFLGDGLEQDYRQAMVWLRKAAEQGDLDAQNIVGYLYAKGRDVSQDYGQALRWYAPAVRAGHKQASYNLAEALQHLHSLSFRAASAEVRAGPSKAAPLLLEVRPPLRLYQLGRTSNGWFEVYLEKNHTIGYISSESVYE